jgi:hypothetical protein
VTGRDAEPVFSLDFDALDGTPVDVVCPREPPCTDLICDLEGVLRDKERWPEHLCYEELLQQSTSLWAGGCMGSLTQVATERWTSMHPLPVGREAVITIGDRCVRGPGHENKGLEGLEELLNIVPFDGYEQAMWALRVERKKLTAVSALDLFGLAEYPTEAHRKAGVPVAGRLGFVARGQDESLLELLYAARKWWASFRGLTFKGRPPGTGTWGSREDFERALRRAVGAIRADEGKITQERVADYLNTSDRYLRYWLDTHGLSWQEVKSQF